MSKFDSLKPGGGKIPPATRPPVKIWDADNLPAGYDPNIWYLAGVFVAEAEWAESPRTWHRFAVYAKLYKLYVDVMQYQGLEIESPEILSQTFQAIRSWYAFRDGNGPRISIPDRQLTGPTWRQYLEIGIVDYWTWPERFAGYDVTDGLDAFVAQDVAASIDNDVARVIDKVKQTQVQL
jgi:hypothetical protein